MGSSAVTRARRKAAGLCYACEEPAVIRGRCMVHYERQKKWDEEYHSRLQRDGKCRRCYQPYVEGMSKCYCNINRHLNDKLKEWR